MVTLAELASTSETVAGTASRLGKVAALADLLGRSAGPAQARVLAGLLAGAPRQGRVGVGWAALRTARGVPPAAASSLTIADLDAALQTLAAAAGPGSAGRRREVLGSLFGQATPPEQDLLVRLLSGELRQGASEGVLLDGLARAGGVPAALVRRALMVSGDLADTAAAALAGSPAAARTALGALSLRVGVPLRPMLASPAASVAAALAEAGAPAPVPEAGTPADAATATADPATESVLVEHKLDGARIQVHRDGADIAVFTRTLHEVTGRVPEIVAAVRALPVRAVVLDGETLMLDAGDRPRSFQDTMARFGSGAAEPDAGWRPDAPVDRAALQDAGARVLRPFFFDVLHAEGGDLLDEPLADRRAVLATVAAGLRVTGTETATVADAETVAADALAGGQEGVVVKDLRSSYAAGRRGRAWLKVKPVHTLDLVVLGVEHGSGRRRGWLSNLHLGARDPGGGPPVMVGKTFKGLTDALLRWQTDTLRGLALADDGWVVWVRPELVVEIAVDGAQVSPRYPGGVTLRFARVLRYRPDKEPADADTLDAVRALLPGAGAPAAKPAAGGPDSPR